MICKNYRFSLFSCCLSVGLWLNKGDYPENSHVVFCLNKYRSFQPFICLGFNTVKLTTFPLMHVSNGGISIINNVSFKAESNGGTAIISNVPFNACIKR